MNKKRKIGFFGGSFDPLHLGHLNLAIELKEKAGLDAVVFSPAFLSPHKVDSLPKASPKDRLAMVNLALEDIEGFFVWEEEILKEKISFTIDALKIFSSLPEYKNEDLFLILGARSASSFHLWKDVKEILQITTPLIGGMEIEKENFLTAPLPLDVKNQFQKHFHSITPIDISSTLIRERLKKGLYCGHLLPAKVLDYIYYHQLY